MPVLLTGGSGFIGGRITRLLCARGEQVRCLVRSSSRVDHLQDLDLELVTGDLTQPASLKAAVEGCDLIYHVAASYRLWSRNPEELYRSNVEGVRSLLEAAEAAGCRRVVYCSSVGVLGTPSDGRPGDEESPVALADMVGHYKRSKFLAEEEARRAADRGLPVVIVNPSTPVGPGDLRPTETGRIITRFLNRQLPFVLDTGLNLVDVDDVAAGHLLAAERGAPGRRYILGNQNLTLAQIASMLAEITGLPAPRGAIPYAAAWTVGALSTFFQGSLLGREPAVPLEGVRMARKRMWFDSSRAVRELGLPQTPVRDSLLRAVHWFCLHEYAPRPPLWDSIEQQAAQSASCPAGHAGGAHGRE